MTFWTSQRIHKALDSTASPFVKSDHSRVDTACYEMGLGCETFETSNGNKRKYTVGEQIHIPPGQFCLLLTEEELNLPSNVLAFISIKASKKMTGLINISGFHVDPGFKGCLKFSVYNAGSKTIVLDVGHPLFPIWFFELSEENQTPYNGSHMGQRSISSSDVERLLGEVASPGELKIQIDKIRAELKMVKNTAYLAITAIILPLRYTVLASFFKILYLR